MPKTIHTGGDLQLNKNSSGTRICWPGVFIYVLFIYLYKPYLVSLHTSMKSVNLISSPCLSSGKLQAKIFWIEDDKD